MPQDQPVEMSMEELVEKAATAAKYDAHEYGQFRETLTALAALNQPPSRFGKWIKPATQERKLVLFTLGVTVILIVIFVFIIELTDGPTSVTTPLVTLAGTGLGFIGGMVASPSSKDTDEAKPSESTTDQGTVNLSGSEPPV